MNAFIAIGQIKNSQKRIDVAHKLKNLKFNIPYITASTSIVN